MNVQMDVSMEEKLERAKQARLYSARTEFRRIKAERKFAKLVSRIFWGSVLFWLWAVTLTVLLCF